MHTAKPDLDLHLYIDETAWGYVMLEKSMGSMVSNYLAKQMLSLYGQIYTQSLNPLKRTVYCGCFQVDIFSEVKS